MELIERERDAGSKPSAAFVEDELAIMVLGGGTAVKGGGAVAALASGGASHCWQCPLS